MLIKDVNHIEVLRRLYNNSHAQGLSMFADSYTTEDMTYKEAEDHFEKRQFIKLEGSEYKYFDYFQGRVMKIGINENEIFSTDLYDRDVGKGECRRIVKELREENKKWQQ